MATSEQGNSQKSTTLQLGSKKMSLSPDQFRQCVFIIDELVSTYDCHQFMAPVPSSATIYHSRIKHPMDFKTLEEKLFRNKYKTVKDFAKDLFLIWENAMRFHLSVDPIYQQALTLKKRYDEIILFIRGGKRPLYLSTEITDVSSIGKTVIPEELYNGSNASHEQTNTSGKSTLYGIHIFSEQDHSSKRMYGGTSQHVFQLLNSYFFEYMSTEESARKKMPLPRLYIAKNRTLLKQAHTDLNGALAIIYDLKLTPINVKNETFSKIRATVLLAEPVKEVHDVDDSTMDFSESVNYSPKAWIKVKPLQAAVQNVESIINREIDRNCLKKVFTTFRLSTKYNTDPKKIRNFEVARYFAQSMLNPVSSNTPEASSDIDPDILARLTSAPPEPVIPQPKSPTPQASPASSSPPSLTTSPTKTLSVRSKKLPPAPKLRSKVVSDADLAPTKNVYPSTSNSESMPKPKLKLKLPKRKVSGSSSLDTSPVAEESSLSHKISPSLIGKPSPILIPVGDHESTSKTAASLINKLNLKIPKHSLSPKEKLKKHKANHHIILPPSTSTPNHHIILPPSTSTQKSTTKRLTINPPKDVSQSQNKPIEIILPPSSKKPTKTRKPTLHQPKRTSVFFPIDSESDAESPTEDKQPSPKATTPKATTPKATTPKATTPKATTPKATTPKATTPKATSSKELSPKEPSSKEPTPSLPNFDKDSLSDTSSVNHMDTSTTATSPAVTASPPSHTAHHQESPPSVVSEYPLDTDSKDNSLSPLPSSSSSRYSHPLAVDPMPTYLHSTPDTQTGSSIELDMSNGANALPVHPYPTSLPPLRLQLSVSTPLDSRISHTRQTRNANLNPGMRLFRLLFLYDLLTIPSFSLVYMPAVQSRGVLIRRQAYYQRNQDQQEAEMTLGNGINGDVSDTHSIKSESTASYEYSDPEDQDEDQELEDSVQSSSEDDEDSSSSPSLSSLIESDQDQDTDQPSHPAEPGQSNELGQLSVESTLSNQATNASMSTQPVLSTQSIHSTHSDQSDLSSQSAQSTFFTVSTLSTLPSHSSESTLSVQSSQSTLSALSPIHSYSSQSTPSLDSKYSQSLDTVEANDSLDTIVESDVMQIDATQNETRADVQLFEPRRANPARSFTRYIDQFENQKPSTFYIRSASRLWTKMAKFAKQKGIPVIDIHQYNQDMAIVTNSDFKSVFYLPDDSTKVIQTFGRMPINQRTSEVIGLLQLTKLPHMPKVYEVLHDGTGEIVGVCMQRFEKTLKDYIYQNTLTPYQQFDIVTQLLEATLIMHEIGLAHRHLSTVNFMVSETDEVLQDKSKKFDLSVINFRSSVLTEPSCYRDWWVGCPEVVNPDYDDQVMPRSLQELDIWCRHLPAIRSKPAGRDYRYHPLETLPQHASDEKVLPHLVNPITEDLYTLGMIIWEVMLIMKPLVSINADNLDTLRKSIREKTTLLNIILDEITHTTMKNLLLKLLNPSAEGRETAKSVFSWISSPFVDLCLISELRYPAWKTVCLKRSLADSTLQDTTTNNKKQKT
ncbi:hypothetical protein [Parasitella parasitica]|uniref:Bromo domain-containing protein n=1 Tax=Parasitella parasitica TaxID=35722 RepID=A0A0B7N301_9FUNG|nr:hypothetical protein [Parasitella parasitica]